MATNVTQVSPVDTRFEDDANYGSYREFQIPGQSTYVTPGTANGPTTYVIDDSAEIVYEFNPLSSTLDNTGGNYDAFITFLAANPVTATVGPPSATASADAVQDSSTPPEFEPDPSRPSRVEDRSALDQLGEINMALRAIHAAIVSLAVDGDKYRPQDFAIGNPDFTPKDSPVKFS